jgi:hypothetical protein
MSTPLARRAVHAGTASAPSHHCVVASQSASVTQASPHAPLAWQMSPAWIAPGAAQATTPPAIPHVVHAPPFPGQ